MFTHRLQILVAFSILTLILGIVISPASAADKELPVKVSEEVQSISKSNNEFAFDLYGQLRQDEGNLFFSPTSISTALAMTYAGAEGDSATHPSF